MSPKWVCVGIAAVIALLIVLSIKMVVSVAQHTEGKNLIIVLEVAVFSLIACSYVGREVVKLVGYLTNVMSRDRVTARALELELRDIAILFGSLIVSMGIYAAFSALI